MEPIRYHLPPPSDSSNTQLYKELTRIINELSLRIHQLENPN